MEQKSAASLLSLVYGDAAVRMAEEITTAYLNGYVGGWIAVRLSDGGTDGHAYANKADAIKYQLNEFQCCYVKVPLAGMTPKMALTYLKIHRQLYDAGLRLADPTRGVIIPR